jgi:YHS domain-containing protein
MQLGRLYSILALAAALTVPPLAAQTAAGAKVLINTDRQGLALEGYDPVAFFVDGRPVQGSAAYRASYLGAEYRFASEEHRTAFEAEPAKYAPQFGGYCAYGVSQGHTAPVRIDTWQIVGGRLLLNYSQSVKRKFDADQAANLQKADANWPGVVEREGKRLER